MPSTKARSERATSSAAPTRDEGGSRALKNKAIRKITSILGRGRQGETLARSLVKKGVRSRAALRKPEIIRKLPKEFQMNVMYPPPASKISLAEADAIAGELTRRVKFCPERTSKCFKLPLYVGGSIRRRCPRIGDIDLLVHLPARLASISNRILDSVQLSDPKSGDRAIIMDSYIGGERHRVGIVRWAPLDDGGGVRRPTPKFFRIDLILVIGDELPFALFHYTGPTSYNIRTRAYAKRKGFMLNQYGLWSRSTGRRVPGTEKVKTEADIAMLLGITARDPTDRER
jgi:DNA polymerase/3'-5' exonuclease PolX